MDVYAQTGTGAGTGTLPPEIPIYIDFDYTATMVRDYEITYQLTSLSQLTLGMATVNYQGPPVDVPGQWEAWIDQIGETVSNHITARDTLTASIDATFHSLHGLIFNTLIPDAGFVDFFTLNLKFVPDFGTESNLVVKNIKPYLMKLTGGKATSKRHDPGMSQYISATKRKPLWPTVQVDGQQTDTSNKLNSLQEIITECLRVDKERAARTPIVAEDSDYLKMPPLVQATLDSAAAASLGEINLVRNDIRGLIRRLTNPTSRVRKWAIEQIETLDKAGKPIMGKDKLLIEPTGLIDPGKYYGGFWLFIVVLERRHDNAFLAHRVKLVANPNNGKITIENVAAPNITAKESKLGWVSPTGALDNTGKDGFVADIVLFAWADHDFNPVRKDAVLKVVSFGDGGWDKESRIKGDKANVAECPDPKQLSDYHPRCGGQTGAPEPYVLAQPGQPGQPTRLTGGKITGPGMFCVTYDELMNKVPRGHGSFVTEMGDLFPEIAPRVVEGESNGEIIKPFDRFRGANSDNAVMNHVEHYIITSNSYADKDAAIPADADVS